MYYNLRTPYPNELYHHGIKGQKWGVRRYQNPDGSLTAEGRIRYGVGTRKKHEGIEEDKVAKAAQKLMHKYEKERYSSKIDKKTGLRLTTSKKTISENAERTNPGYWAFPSNTLFRENCVNCSIAFELRNRGYEVQALPSRSKNMDTVYDKCFPNGLKRNIIEEDPWDKAGKKYGFDPNTGKPLIEGVMFTESSWAMIRKDVQQMYDSIDPNSTMKKAKEAFSKEPPNSRGGISMAWNIGSGHSMNYAITKDGSLLLIDPQSGKTFSGEEVDKILKIARSFNFERLDNLDINYEACRKEIVR